MVRFSAVPSVRQPEQPLPPEIIENTIATMIAVVMTTMIAGLTGSLVAISAHRARRKRATAETLHALRCHFELQRHVVRGSTQTYDVVLSIIYIHLSLPDASRHLFVACVFSFDDNMMNSGSVKNVDMPKTVGLAITSQYVE